MHQGNQTQQIYVYVDGAWKRRPKRFELAACPRQRQTCKAHGAQWLAQGSLDSHKMSKGKRVIKVVVDAGGVRK